MVIICEECGRKYKIDPSKMKGEEAKFKCKSCSHMIVVNKPAPPKEKQTPDDITAPAVPTKPEPEQTFEEKPAQQPKEKKVVKKIKKTAHARPKKFRFGLTAKLFIMMIFVSLVPLMLFWYIALTQTPEQLRNDTKKNINQISIGIAKHVNEWLDKNIGTLKTFAKMEDMISMDRFLQEPLLETIRDVYPWINLSYTIDLDGMNVARNDAKPLKNYADHPYYKNVIAGKTIAWHTLIQKSSKKPALILAVPIKNGDEIVGVIANEMSIDDLSRRIVTWEGGDTGFAFLVDENGKVLAHKNREYVRKQKNLRHHPLVSAFRSGKTGSVTFNDKGKSILGHARGTVFGWIIAIQQEEREAFALVDQLMSYAYILLIVTVVFVLIMAWFSGRALSRPIIKLTDTADRISVGELDVEIHTQRKDEIGDLAEAIARMQDSIRVSIERLRHRR
ncbi:cache domain-containing protein [Thermodesulfobacteriota bacterium]